MQATAAAEPSGSFRTAVRTITNRLSAFNVGLGSLSGVSTMLLILVIVPDVLARKFLSVTIPFASETAVLLLMGKIFLGLPGAQASNANFHVTMLLERLPPGAARALRAVCLMLSLIFAALISLYVTQEAVASTIKQEAIFVGAQQFPVWPQRVIVSIGFVFLAIQLAADVLRAVLGLPPSEIKTEGKPMID